MQLTHSISAKNLYSLKLIRLIAIEVEKGRCTCEIKKEWQNATCLLINTLKETCAAKLGSQADLHI